MAAAINTVHSSHDITLQYIIYNNMNTGITLKAQKETAHN